MYTTATVLLSYIQRNGIWKQICVTARVTLQHYLPSKSSSACNISVWQSYFPLLGRLPHWHCMRKLGKCDPCENLLCTVLLLSVTICTQFHGFTSIRRKPFCWVLVRKSLCFVSVQSRQNLKLLERKWTLVTELWYLSVWNCLNVFQLQLILDFKKW
jgi:hypothetical protein